MKVKKKRKSMTETDIGIATMIKNDGELHIMNEEYIKETKRIMTNFKSLDRFHKKILDKLHKTWAASLLGLYYSIELETTATSKIRDQIMKNMWKILDKIKIIL